MGRRCIKAPPLSCPKAASSYEVHCCTWGSGLWSGPRPNFWSRSGAILEARVGFSVLLGTEMIWLTYVKPACDLSLSALHTSCSVLLGVLCPHHQVMLLSWLTQLSVFWVWVSRVVYYRELSFWISNNWIQFLLFNLIHLLCDLSKPQFLQLLNEDSKSTYLIMVGRFNEIMHVKYLAPSPAHSSCSFNVSVLLFLTCPPSPTFGLWPLASWNWSRRKGSFFPCSIHTHLLSSHQNCSLSYSLKAPISAAANTVSALDPGSSCVIVVWGFASKVWYSFISGLWETMSYPKVIPHSILSYNETL